MIEIEESSSNEASRMVAETMSITLQKQSFKGIGESKCLIV